MPAKPIKPNVPTQSSTEYKAAIDSMGEATFRTAAAFAPSAQDTPDMTVRVEGGAIFSGTTLTEVAAQNTGIITAPTTNPRIDRVVIDRLTGVAAVVTGTPAATPTPPAIPAGKLPVAQVLLTVGMTAITNAAITDERQLTLLGLDTPPSRNRLCNGDFLVDNINGGAAVTPGTGTSAFVVENFALHFSQTSKITAQRVAASNIAGLKYSMLLSVASAVASPGAADYFNARSGIEGWQDWDDMGWGTAAAKDMTIQMYARVSVAGEYSFAVQNGARNRSYVFTKNLAAGDNYWTQTVPGDTTGTWPVDNQTCVMIIMDLGSGSDYETATIGAWQTGNYTRKSTSVKWISNAAATYEFGGRKVERGSFATPGGRFRDEDAWCRRYHPCIRNDVAGTPTIGVVACRGTRFAICYISHPVAPRVAPTGMVCSAMSSFMIYDSLSGAGTPSACTINSAANSVAISTATDFMVARGAAEFYFSGPGFIRFTGAEL